MRSTATKEGGRRLGVARLSHSRKERVQRIKGQEDTAWIRQPFYGSCWMPKKPEVT
jgi:hypothetical protein